METLQILAAGMPGPMELIIIGIIGLLIILIFGLLVRALIRVLRAPYLRAPYLYSKSQEEEGTEEGKG